MWDAVTLSLVLALALSLFLCSHAAHCIHANSKHRSFCVCIAARWLEAHRDIVQTFFRLSWFYTDFLCVHKHIVYLFRYTPFTSRHQFVLNLVIRELLLVAVVNAVHHIFSYIYFIVVTASLHH